MGYNIQELDFEEFKNCTSKKEGLVLLGCGGSLDEWRDGVVELLKKEQHIKRGFEDFSNFYKLTTTGGRIDLAMVFDNNADMNIGSMALWRLRFGDCSWISDYKDNYEHHFRADS